MPKGWASPSTARLIRDFLIEQGEAYPKQIYQYLKQKIEELGYKPPNYASVRKLVYVLRKLGLIRRVREEPVRENPTAFKRCYYAVVHERLDDPAWENPYSAYFYPAKFKEQRKFYPVSPEEWMEKVRAKRRS